MQHTFELGKNEKRQIRVSINKWIGKIKIWVSDPSDPTSEEKELVNSFFIFGGDNNHELTVGKREKHNVRVVLKKPVFFAMFRKWWLEVFVDGEHYKTLK